jgi:hypothetical protein
MRIAGALVQALPCQRARFGSADIAENHDVIDLTPGGRH